MKTVTYHCDYCNDLIPENGEMIQLQSDSGINVSNTFKLSKECKLNNWKEFHFCTITCMKNMFLGVAKPAPAPAVPPIPAPIEFPKTENVNPDDTAEKYYNNPEKSATKKPSEEFTSYLFFIHKEGNCVEGIKKEIYEDPSFHGENFKKGMTLIDGVFHKNALCRKKYYEQLDFATINEAAKLISLIEKSEPGLKVHFANPKL